MFCPNCGNKNEEEAVFCAFCGTKIIEPEAAAQVQPEAVQAQPEAVQMQPEAVQAQPTAAQVQPEAVQVQPAAAQAQPTAAQMQQTGYYNNVQGGYYGAAANPPQAPKKKINKCMVASLIEAGVLVLAIAAFILIGKNAYGYEKTAERFFQAYESGNWERAYENLDISESKFIDKKHFAAINRQNETTEINQFHIIEKNENGIVANVTIQYSEKGSSDVSLMYLTLNKQPKKKFFLFDEWKISSSQYVAKNYNVEVPKGAVLYLDQEEVPEEMLAEDSDVDEGYHTYTIPKLFAGSHTLAIKIGDFTSAGENVYVSGEEDYAYISSLNLSKQQQEELLQTAYTDLQNILSAGVCGDNFSKIRNMYSSECQERANDSYESFLSHFVSAGQQEGITEIRLTNVKGNFTSNYIDDGEIVAEVELAYDYTVDFMDYDWWYSKLESDTYDSYDSIYLTFVYVDGTWKLNTDSMPYFRYY